MKVIKHLYVALLLSALFGCVTLAADGCDDIETAFCTCQKNLEISTKVRVDLSMMIEFYNAREAADVSCKFGSSAETNISLLMNDGLGRLEITQGSIPHLSIDDFDKSAKLTQLIITGSGLSNVSYGALSNAKRLTYLNLSNNYLSSLGFLKTASGNLIILDISRNHVTAPSRDDFISQPGLQSIDLSNNQLTSLDWFNGNNLAHLMVLNLSLNHIGSIPAGVFGTNSKLHSLDLSHNDITHLEFSSFINLTQLHLLAIKNNKLLTIEPDTFTELCNLEYLHLTSNMLTNFAYKPKRNDINFDIYKLRELRLDKNRISGLDKELRDSLRRMPKLDYLRFRGNDISYIPDSFFSGLGELKELYIGLNPIGKMAPNSITSLPKLEKLSLLENIAPLTIDFSESRDLCSMSILNLSNAGIVAIKPPLLEGFPNLTHLHLKRNFISEADIFKSSHHNQHLTHIDLSENRIAQLTEDTFAEECPNCQYLDLHSNMLKEFELSILTGMVNLVYLDISYNKIEVLSALKAQSMYILQQLQYINASHNQLTYIDHIQNIHFKSLKEILLSDNSLSTIPECLFAAAHRSKLLQKVNFVRNSIICDCQNAWLRELDERIPEVVHASCEDSEYSSANFPVKSCEAHERKLLAKLRCTASTQKPNLELILFFATAVGVLFLIILGDTLRKRVKKYFFPEPSGQALVEVKESSHSMSKEDNRLDESFSAIMADMSFRSTNRLNSLGGGKLNRILAPFSPRISKAGQKKTSGPSRGLKMMDEAARADLIKKLQKLDQADHVEHSPHISTHMSEGQFANGHEDHNDMKISHSESENNSPHTPITLNEVNAVLDRMGSEVLNVINPLPNQEQKEKK